MNFKLNQDEFRILRRIYAAGRKAKAPSGMHLQYKKLAAQKLIIFRRDGSAELTAQGQQAIFADLCLTALKELSDGKPVQLTPEVRDYLSRKSMICRDEENNWKVTDKAREILADAGME